MQLTSQNTFYYVMLFSILLIGCTGHESAERPNKKVDKRDWTDIKKDSVLTVLAENSPVSYFIYRGKNMGYEYELLHEFCKDKKIRLQVKMINDLDEMIQQLNENKGDIIACNLTVTEKRKQTINFTVPHDITHQVLIQRKPDGYKKMSKKAVAKKQINTLEELKGKTIHVWRNSTYYTQLITLNQRFNLELALVPTDGNLITAELIRMVSEGEIDYTIADENIAKIDADYYPNIDISMKLSGDEAIAFGLKKDATSLRDTLNSWLLAKENLSTIAEVSRKYFDRKHLSRKANEEYSSVSGSRLSPFDDIIKIESAKIGWDWRLIAAIIYQESKFKIQKESWAGAFGIFQFMPSTASGYGINQNSSAEDQIRAGIAKLDKNYKQWKTEIKDSVECFKFTLATFNAGKAHIDDARALSKKYNLKDSVWENNVAEMVKNLSIPKYYRDEVVKFGYCRGTETYKYVIEVIQRFEEYKSAFPKIEKDASDNVN